MENTKTLKLTNDYIIDNLFKFIVLQNNIIFFIFFILSIASPTLYTGFILYDKINIALNIIVCVVIVLLLLFLFCYIVIDVKPIAKLVSYYVSEEDKPSKLEKWYHMKIEKQEQDEQILL